jgi:hypothetical protein
MHAEEMEFWRYMKRNISLHEIKNKDKQKVFGKWKNQNTAGWNKNCEHI